MQDDIVIYEVMAEELDRPWWKQYREQLTLAFRKALLIVRVCEIELL